MYSLSIFSFIYIFPTLFHKNLKVVCRSPHRAMRLKNELRKWRSMKYKYLEIRDQSNSQVKTIYKMHRPYVISHHICVYICVWVCVCMIHIYTHTQIYIASCLLLNSRNSHLKCLGLPSILLSPLPVKNHPCFLLRAIQVTAALGWAQAWLHPVRISCPCGSTCF